MHHYVPANPKTVHWGYWDGSLAPILTIRSGDSVTLDTLSGEPADLPPSATGFCVLPDHREVLNVGRGGPGPHLLTGPIAVDGARAGDVLEVHIRNIALQAAFLAADSNEPVTMSHLLRAARSEYDKLEKPLTETEIASWL